MHACRTVTHNAVHSLLCRIYDASVKAPQHNGQQKEAMLCPENMQDDIKFTDEKQ